MYFVASRFISGHGSSNSLYLPFTLLDEKTLGADIAENFEEGSSFIKPHRTMPDEVVYIFLLYRAVRTYP